MTDLPPGRRPSPPVAAAIVGVALLVLGGLLLAASPQAGAQTWVLVEAETAQSGTLGGAQSSTWSATGRTGATNGTAWQTTLPGWGQVVCECTQIRVTGWATSGGANFAVTIDGQPMGSYATNTASGWVVLYTSPVLAQGPHTMRMDWSANGETGTIARLDYYEFLGAPGPTTTTTTAAPTTTTTEATTTTAEATTTTAAETTTTTEAATTTSSTDGTSSTTTSPESTSTTSTATGPESSCAWEWGGVVEGEPQPCGPDKRDVSVAVILLGLGAGALVGGIVFRRPAMP